MGQSQSKEPAQAAWTFGKEQFDKLISRLNEVSEQKTASERQFKALKRQTEAAKRQNEQFLAEIQVSFG